jgi:hypothetical protein
MCVSLSDVNETMMGGERQAIDLSQYHIYYEIFQVIQGILFISQEEKTYQLPYFYLNNG